MAMVYGLFDSVTSKVRYIGVTIKPLQRRLSAHIREAKLGGHGRHRRNWINSVLKTGRTPQIVPIAIVADDQMFEYERLVIALAKSHGFCLVNGSDGGEGPLGMKHSDESKALMSMRQKGHPGHVYTEDTRALMSDRQKARFERERASGQPRWALTVRVKMAEARRRHWADPEKRARLMAAKYGRPMSDKAKQALVVANQDPGYRAKYLAGLKNRAPRGPHSEESKAKMSAALRLSWERRRAAAQ